MAGDKKKLRSGTRSRSEDMGNGILFPLFLQAVMTFVFWATVLSCGKSVIAAPITVTNETMVVTSQTLLYGPCIDDTGAEVGDGAEWSTACNKIVCHVEPSGNYSITHGCRSIVPSENPDTTNCVSVENTGASYPDCCPYQQCGAASGLSTINPTLCYDISDFSTCQIWKEMSSNCTDTSSFVYNFSLIYCQSSCGLCSGGSG